MSPENHQTLAAKIMIAPLLEMTKQFLPNGICEYSIRRHAYMRSGFSSGQASRLAFSRKLYRMFEDSRLNLVPREIVDSLGTCVDAGAHMGSWAESLLRLFSPPRVMLVECEPQLASQLREKFSGIQNAVVIEAALAETTGSAAFNRLRHPAISSLLEPRPGIEKEFVRSSWDVIEKVNVATITYDELVANVDQVSLLKLDVQGAEQRVLANSGSGLEKTLCIILEANFLHHYSGDALFPELHALLEKKCFGLYQLSPIYHRGGRALFADAIYVQEKILSHLAP